MTEEYWIIDGGYHEIGYPLGKILFRGTKEDAKKHAAKVGNANAPITKAVLNMGIFLEEESNDE